MFGKLSISAEGFCKKSESKAKSESQVLNGWLSYVWRRAAGHLWRLWCGRQPANDIYGGCSLHKKPYMTAFGAALHKLLNRLGSGSLACRCMSSCRKIQSQEDPRQSWPRERRVLVLRGHARSRPVSPSWDRRRRRRGRGRRDALHIDNGSPMCWPRKGSTAAVGTRRAIHTRGNYSPAPPTTSTPTNDGEAATERRTNRGISQTDCRSVRGLRTTTDGRTARRETDGWIDYWNWVTWVATSAPRSSQPAIGIYY